MAQYSGNPGEVARHLGLRVRERRRDLGLTQQDLADLAGIGVRSVHELEHGKATIRFEIISTVLTSLGLSLGVDIMHPAGARSEAGALDSQENGP